MKCPGCGIELGLVKANGDKESDVWKSDPATEKQVSFLQRYGINGKQMTKGEASAEIDKILKG